MKKYLFLLTIIMLLSLVVAQKEFNPNIPRYGQIQIDDYLFFNKADYSLTEYNCELFSCYAEGNYKLYRKTHLFQELKYKNSAGYEGKYNYYKFFIEENITEQKNISTFNETCNEQQNGTVCTPTKNGTTTINITKKVWKPYTKNTELDASEGRWRIEVQRKPTFKSDFILQAHDYDFTEWAWWNNSYTYKKALYFNKSQGNPTPTINQIKVNISWVQGMAGDFSNIRFSNPNENDELAYFIESKVDGAWADVWIKLNDSITSSNQTLAYLYYNATGVSSKSSNQSTFFVVDDFDATNSSLWYNIEGSQSVSGGVMTVNADWIIASNTTTTPKLYGTLFEMKTGGGTSWTDASALYPRNVFGTVDDDWIFWGTNCNKQYWGNGNEGVGSSGACPSGLTIFGSTDKISAVLANSSKVEYYINDVLSQSITANIPDEPLYVSFRGWGGGQLTVDWVRVRSWNDTPITYGIGIEQINTNPPIITSINPTNNTVTLNNTLYFSSLVYDDVGIQNVSFFFNGILEQNNISGLNNTVYLFNKTILTAGNYTYSFRSCDTDGECTNSSTYNINKSNLLEVSASWNANVSVTSTQSFMINYSTNGTAPTNAYLYYNGTSYLATITDLGSGNYSFNKTLQMGTTSGTFDWYYNFLWSGTTYNSTIRQQQVTPITFTICNATFNTPYLRFVFKDEGNLTDLSATNDLTDVDYYIGSGESSNNYLYSNNTANQSYSFCFSPTTIPVTVNMTFKYSNTNYPLRTFYYSNQTLTNVTTTQTLYMLSSEQGLYSAIQVVDEVTSPVQGAVILVERQISGVWITVGQDTTGDDGIATFWVNPNFAHRITVTASGYTTKQVTITPSQASYTIQISSADGGTINYYRGITNRITPTDNFLDNNTLYNFSYTLNSTYWTVTEFGFKLYYANNHSLLRISNDTTNGGIITFNNVNVTGTGIYARYYYVVNNTTITSGAARDWYLLSSQGRTYSIKQFFERFNSYADAGLLGMDDFTRVIIVLAIIIITVGMINMKYGLNNDAVLMGIIFGVVFFLDVGIGMIPTFSIGDRVAIPHLITYITALIMIGFIIKENQQ